MRHRSVVLALVVTLLVAACGSEPATLEIEGPTLTYTALGNSIDFDVIHPYAEMLEDDFEVEVEIRNHTQSGLSAPWLLQLLRTNTTIRSDLASADVVTFLIPKSPWIEAFYASDGATEDCGGDDGQDCWRDALAAYQAEVDAILAELTAIVDPSETLVRVHDDYVYEFAGTEADLVMMSYWEAGEEYLEQAAAEYGIPVAQVFDAFHGLDGTSIPCDEGLLQADCLHPGPDGARLIATLLHDLGYELAN